MRILTLSVFAALLSAPAFAADPGTYRPGTPYGSTVATGADVCDNQCSGDAQCRGWNYVKPNPRAAGICEFLSTVSAPISSQISISGENQAAAPFYSGLTAGQTNTVRVGAPVVAEPVRVGEAPPRRRVVRQALPERVQTQTTSTRSVQNMSLTEQQNRYRQGLAGTPTVQNQQTQPAQPRTRSAALQPQGRQAMPNQRPMFRPILDAPAQVRGQQVPQFQTQPQVQPARQHASRRVTGPRRVQQPTQGYAAPQFNDPRAQLARETQAQQQMPSGGQSRPPIGQPIPAPQAAIQGQPQRPMTPSQRLAQLAAHTQISAGALQSTGPVALDPQQARKSLFGSLNDDVAIPTASAVPTQPVAEQALGEVLAGGR